MAGTGWTRRLLTLVAVTIVASCGGGQSTGPINPPPPPGPPPPAPPPPPPAPGRVPDVQQVIPPSGGTLSITTADHPYRGLSLTVPGGSFEAQGTWRVGVDSTVTLTDLPAGAVQAGPALVITTDQARATHLLTLEVPVPSVPGTTTVLVMRDPVRGVIELPLIVGSDARTVRVAGAHLNASLLVGPGVGAAVRSSGLSIGHLFPVQLPSRFLDAVVPTAFSALRDLWPAPDAGSGNFPDGHGPAASILSFVSQFLSGHPGLATMVKPMGTAGMLADTAAFASLLRAALTYREAGPSLAPVFADLAAMFSSLTAAGRDSLASLNLRAAMLLTRRAQLMVLQSKLAAAIPAFETSEWGMAVGAEGNAISVVKATSASPGSPLTLLLGSAGFQGPLFRNVLDAAPRPAGSILPAAGSFLLPLERFLSILPDLAAARAASGQARGSLNRGLAAAGGFPDITVLFQQAKDAVATALLRDTVIARDDDAAVQLDCTSCPDGTADVAVVDTVTRAEVSRSSGGGRIRLGGLGGFGLGGLPAGAFKAFIGQALSRVPTITGQLERMLIPFGVTIMRLPFAIPARINLAVGDTVRYTMRVAPRTGEEWQIEWNWGDGTPLEIVDADSVAEHEYPTRGTYSVTATLKLGSQAPLPVAARTVGIVVVGNAVTWNLTSFTGPTTSPVPFGWTSGNANGLINELYGPVAGDFESYATTLQYVMSNPRQLNLELARISPARISIVGYGDRPSCDAAAPNAIAVTGGTADGTFTAHRVVKCADPGEVVFEDLTVTKTGDTIEGALVVTIRDYTYDQPNQKGFRPLQEYLLRYEFTGERAR